MNLIQQAQQAYSPGHGALRSARSIELQVFGEVTSRLRMAAGSTNNTAFSELAAALHDNRRLWAHLAASVADSSNGLPQDLRARIFYLAEFTDIHSRRVLRDGADPAPLVEINSAVMRGLGHQPSSRTPT